MARIPTDRRFKGYPGEKRMARIGLAVTEEEKRQIREAAEAEDMSVAEFIRCVALRHARNMVEEESCEKHDTSRPRRARTSTGRPYARAKGGKPRS